MAKFSKRRNLRKRRKSVRNRKLRGGYNPPCPICGLSNTECDYIDFVGWGCKCKNYQCKHKWTEYFDEKKY